MRNIALCLMVKVGILSLPGKSRQRYFLSPFLFIIVLKILASKVKQKQKVLKSYRLKRKKELCL